MPGRTGCGEGEIDGGAREAAAFELLRAAVAGLAAGEIDVSDATRSMAPLLVGGERLRWRRRTPRFGDVAVFFRGRALVAHRVVGRRGGALRTKGDALAALDGSDDVRARCRAIAVERERVAAALRALGARVAPSRANFLFFVPADGAAARLFRDLRARGVLVRDLSAASPAALRVRESQAAMNTGAVSRRVSV